MFVVLCYSSASKLVLTRYSPGAAYNLVTVCPAMYKLVSHCSKPFPRSTPVHLETEKEGRWVEGMKVSAGYITLQVEVVVGNEFGYEIEVD